MAKQVWSGRSRQIPLWMYYVRALLGILCGVADLFSLPFGKQLNLNASWSGYMLRHIFKGNKDKSNG